MLQQKKTCHVQVCICVDVFLNLCSQKIVLSAEAFGPLYILQMKLTDFSQKFHYNNGKCTLLNI